MWLLTIATVDDETGYDPDGNLRTYGPYTEKEVDELVFLLNAAFGKRDLMRRNEGLIADKIRTPESRLDLANLDAQLLEVCKNNIGLTRRITETA